MKTTKYVVALVLACASALQAEPTPSIAGRVVDSDGRPIRGATVRVEGAEPIVTDSDGRFRIDAPLGASIVIEAAGYGPGLATATAEPLGEIVLLGEAQLAETIVLESEAPARAPGAARLDREGVQRIPGTGGDVVRALTAMPGVVNLQVPLGFTGVVIRGSSPQDSRVLIDDFEVPLLFHDIGFRAIVPAEAIASLDYVPGGFDVAYGRASSGIVLLTTRPGDAQRSAQAEVSVVDGGLLAQGPAGDRTRYMIGMRRSTIDFVLPAVIPDDTELSLTTVPRYWDGQLRVDHDLSRRWSLTLSSFGADDAFELYSSKRDDAPTKRIFSHSRFARLTAAACYAAGRWRANLAVSGLLARYEFDVGVDQHIDVRSPAVTPRVEVARTIPTTLGLRDVEVRAGAEAQLTRWNVDLAFARDLREGNPNPVMNPDDTSNQFDGIVWTPDAAAWTAVGAGVGRRVRVTAGLRADAFGRSREVAAQPRGEIQLTPAPAWKLRLALGEYRRPAEYQTEFLSRTVKSERATQTIAGAQWDPLEGLRVQLSGYHVARSSLIRDAAMELENTGRGTTYGGELLATYTSNAWLGWLSYSYSHSTRVDSPGAHERLFDYDQPHSLNAAASWRSGRHWQLGGRFQLYSGLPYTPVLGGVLDSDRNVYTPINGPTNSARAPLHHQLDLRVDYNWRLGPVQATAFLDVQNVYLDDSAVTYFYSFDYTQRAAFKSLPLVPSLGLRGVL